MAQTKMQLTDWLDDLSVRFIVNLPREELESVERICFQVEEAQWFYEDFVRPLDPKLPSLNLRQFSMKIFQHCPLFSIYGADVHSKAFSEFLAYKTRVPVRGAILLNEDMDEVILVKGWKKGANWSFPRGKINKDEKDIDCAIREVYEETGYDIRSAGLAGDEHSAKFIEVTMREQHMKLFVFAGIPMETHFEPRTRKEISKIQWYRLSELPTLKKIKQQQQNGGSQDAASNTNKFYMVAPFLNPLKRIIISLKKDRFTGQSANFLAPPIQEISTSPQQSHQNMTKSDSPDGDMARLMTKLRDSKQARRESNLPEVTNPTETARNASIHLKSLLNLTADPDKSDSYEREAATARENKANAMLSLLRAGNDISVGSLNQSSGPQIIPEQLVRQVAHAPSSPFSYTAPKQELDHYVTSLFPYIRDDYHIAANQRSPARTQSDQSVTTQPKSQKTSSILQTNLPSGPSQLYASHGTITAPYQRTGDPQFAQVSQLSGKTGSAIPSASELPPPKLNAQSSMLLNLFKSDQSPLSSAAPISTSLLPADDNIKTERTELAVATPTISQRPHPLLSSNIGPPHMLSSTPALATPSTLPQNNENIKRSSQQEALLNLFRQPKPSPSLLPAEDPVELAAQGSPTYSRTSSEILTRFDGGHHEQVVGGQMNVQRQQERHASSARTTVSATVTGPLNVPQFEKVLRRPHVIHPNASSTTMEEPAASTHISQPLKILSRPRTSDNTMDESNNGERLQSSKSSHSLGRRKNNSSKEKAAFFQPQILKRPQSIEGAPVRASSPKAPGPDKKATGPVPNLEEAPPSVLHHQTPIVDRRSVQSTEQKASLLNLFSIPNTSASNTPFPTRTGSVVSPLSEKPPVESDFPSPVGLGRMRLESVKETGGEAASGDHGVGSKTGTTGAGNSGDKKFLLGFLNGVVRERRN